MTKKLLLSLLIILATTICMEGSKNLPGRPQMPGIFRLQGNDYDIFFYIENNQHQAVKKLVDGIENHMLLSVGIASPTKVQLLPEIMKNISPDADPIGRDIAENYLQTNLINIKRNLGVSLGAPQLHIKFLLNQDEINQPAVKTDQLTLYETTMVDWQMSEGTFSGVIFEQKEGRLIVPFFPHDLCCLAITGRGLPKLFSFSPINYSSRLTPGSTKGKSIIIETWGSIQENQLKSLQAKSVSLTATDSLLETAEREERKQIPHFSHPLKWIGVREDVDIFVYESSKTDEILETINKQTDKRFNNLKAYHMVKRTGGFTNLKDLDLNISENSLIMMINRSSFPVGYEYFNLAEDLTIRGLPWIQLYKCQPHSSIILTLAQFEKLSLTPVEEFLFRRDLTDYRDTVLRKKISTEFDLLILSNE